MLQQNEDETSDQVALKIDFKKGDTWDFQLVRLGLEGASTQRWIVGRWYPKNTEARVNNSGLSRYSILLRNRSRWSGRYTPYTVETSSTTVETSSTTV